MGFTMMKQEQDCIIRKFIIEWNTLGFTLKVHLEGRRGQVVKAGVCKTPIRRSESARRLQF